METGRHWKYAVGEELLYIITQEHARYLQGCKQFNTEKDSDKIRMCF